MTRRTQKTRKRGSRQSTAVKPTTTARGLKGSRRRLGRRLVLFAALLGFLWFTFLDSHSLIKRVRWHTEAAEMRAENASLSAEIERLEQEVSKGLSDDVLEEIAREHYGMRRPGETVYPVEVGE